MKQNVRTTQALLQATLNEAASSESHLQQSRQELKTEEERLEKLKKKVRRLPSNREHLPTYILHLACQATFRPRPPSASRPPSLPATSQFMGRQSFSPSCTPTCAWHTLTGGCSLARPTAWPRTGRLRKAGKSRST